jgi:TIGR03009 family protein
MRVLCLTLAGILTISPNLLAQQPPAQAPAPDPARDRLDALLLEWEAKMKSVDTLSAEVVRERVDNVFHNTVVYKGKAKYMRPNLALLELQRTDRPAIFEKYVCTGAYLYEYYLPNKELRFHELPNNRGQVSDDNFLSFLFGMKAEEAKRRYDLRLVGDPNDKYYVYIEVYPRYPADKADFQKAQLALTKSTYLPRLLTFTEPNGNRIKWDISNIEVGAQIDRKEFTSPPLPPGWRYVRVPKAADNGTAQEQVQPRVIRQQQQ